MKSIAKLNQQSGQQGFSLVEVLVALAISAVASALMAPSFMYHLKTNTKAELKNGAIAAAQQTLDGYRSKDPTTFPSAGTVTTNVPVGERTFSVKAYYCLNASYCETNTRHVKLEVSYRNKLVYAVETIFSKLR